MRIMIAAQDASVRTELFRFLSLAENVDIAVESTAADQVLANVAGGNIDAIFLDTQGGWLPETPAFYATLRAKCPYLITVVADETAATLALDRGATDFILSPVSRPAITRTLIKLRYLRANRTSPNLDDRFGHWLQSIAHHLVKNHVKSDGGRLAVKVGTHIKLISLAKIIYAQASGDYLDITMSTGEILHTKERITRLDSRLPKPLFIRTHRSFIINTDYVREIRSKGNDYELMLTNDMVLSTGSTYRKHVREHLLMDMA